MAFGDKANGKYLQIDPEADLAIVGEEVTGNATFDAGRKRFVWDDAGGFRFGVCVWDGKAVQVLEGGWRLYKALTKVLKKHGATTLVHVSKTGSGLDTQYAAEPVRQLSAEEIAQIAAADAHDLAVACSWATPGGGEKRGAAAPGADDEIPF